MVDRVKLVEINAMKNLCQSLTTGTCNDAHCVSMHIALCAPEFC